MASCPPPEPTTSAPFLSSRPGSAPTTPTPRVFSTTSGLCWAPLETWTPPARPTNAPRRSAKLSSAPTTPTGPTPSAALAALPTSGETYASPALTTSRPSTSTRPGSAPTTPTPPAPSPTSPTSCATLATYPLPAPPLNAPRPSSRPGSIPTTPTWSKPRRASKLCWTTCGTRTHPPAALPPRGRCPCTRRGSALGTRSPQPFSATLPGSHQRSGSQPSFPPTITDQRPCPTTSRPTPDQGPALACQPRPRGSPRRCRQKDFG